MSTTELPSDVQHPTGPKTPGPKTMAGKAISRLNAFTGKYTGQISLMPEPDRLAHEAFCGPLIEDLSPVGPLETHYAQLIATAHWRIDRWTTNEENLFALSLHTSPEEDDPNPELTAVIARTRSIIYNPQAFATISLYIQRATREIARNMEALKALQTERRELRADLIREASKHRRECADEGVPFDPESFARMRSLMATGSPMPSTSQREIGFVFSTEELDAYDTFYALRNRKLDRLREEQKRKDDHPKAA